MYKTVSEMAVQWQVSERTVRNYCATGKIPDALHKGKSWEIPEDTRKPGRDGAVEPPRIGLGYQDFAELMERNLFYIDKTAMIKEWWESGPKVTAVMRPRRFGKTLMLSTLEHFFSNKDAHSSLFKKFKIWEYPEYRELQGTFPVIFVTFAGQKSTTLAGAMESMKMLFSELYHQHYYLLQSTKLTEKQKKLFQAISDGGTEEQLIYAIHNLAWMLTSHFGKEPLILLDEYDTPLQEAYFYGYWDKYMGVMRKLFNATFKTNPFYTKAFLTGITRVSKESLFSDLNNIEIVTTSSDPYATAFGFTEQEVFAAMNMYGYTNKAQIKEWYDGFTFGKYKEIYNPWSISYFLHTGKVQTYWVNTSSNALVNELLCKGTVQLKEKIKWMMSGGTISTFVDEQVCFGDLFNDERAVWSLLLGTGYLKIVDADYELCYYTLALTNKEVLLMLQRMVINWFDRGYHGCNGFLRALLNDDLEDMTDYLQAALLDTVSFFDGVNNPESFYHGFVLGMMVELRGKYLVHSNRESGFGRYDIMLEPVDKTEAGYVLEFKVCRDANKLVETAASALEQIKKKKYSEELLAQGVDAKKIYCYGLVFSGKNVYIAKQSEDSIN